MNSPDRIGLRQRIRHAPDIETLAALVERSTEYRLASSKTVRRWQRAYAVRLQELDRESANVKIK